MEHVDRARRRRARGAGIPIIHVLLRRRGGRARAEAERPLFRASRTATLSCATPGAPRRPTAWSRRRATSRPEDADERLLRHAAETLLHGLRHRGGHRHGRMDAHVDRAHRVRRGPGYRMVVVRTVLDDERRLAQRGVELRAAERLHGDDLRGRDRGVRRRDGGSLNARLPGETPWRRAAAPLPRHRSQVVLARGREDVEHERPLGPAVG